MNYAPHQQRVSNVIGPNFVLDTLAVEEQERLRGQNDILRQYFQNLGKYIEAFQETPKVQQL